VVFQPENEGVAAVRLVKSSSFVDFANLVGPAMAGSLPQRQVQSDQSDFQ
jgi:hypothetical protein